MTLVVENGSGGYSRAKVLHDVNLSIEAGRITAILGRNGAGKSTLFQYLAGVLPWGAGEIKWGGVALPPSAAVRARAGISYVPQGRQIFSNLTTEENIKAAAFGTGHDAKEEVQRAFGLFPALKERAHVMGGSLSGGQQQILALARALATHPKIILLDEPTEGIQPSIVTEIADILVDLNEDKGISIFVAEQNLAFVKRITDVALLMDGGRIVGTASGSELDAESQIIREVLTI